MREPYGDGPDDLVKIGQKLGLFKEFCGYFIENRHLQTGPRENTKQTRAKTLHLDYHSPLVPNVSVCKVH